MLFEIRPNLEQSRVFKGLNGYLREVMLAVLEGRAIDQAGLPNGLCAALAENAPTQGAVSALEAALVALDQEPKDSLRNLLVLDTDPCALLSDRVAPLPLIPGTVFVPLKTLAVHLYQRAAKLSGVEQACGECIDDHYARFRATASPGNGNVCCVCGTEYLAQLQAEVNDTEQWRGPYDHLLAKDHYPLYGIHPKNLVPICHTCNSKAKHAKDLLIKDGNRRLSFSPWSERALPNEIEVVIEHTAELFPRVVVNFKSVDVDRLEKLTTWDEIYEIKARVEGEFQVLREKLAEDVAAPNEATFLERLTLVASAKAKAQRLTPFNYWRARVFLAVRDMDQGSREAMRSAMAATPLDDQEMKKLFYQ